MRLFKLMYNSFILGLVVSVLAFQSEWLEMRINIGYLVPITMIIALISSIVLNKRTHTVLDFNDVITLANIGIGMIICTVVLGFERLMIVPAAIIRELLFLTKVSFDTINIGLIILLIAGLMIVIASDFRKRRSFR